VTDGGLPLGGSVDDEGLIVQLAGGGGLTRTVAGMTVEEMPAELAPYAVNVDVTVTSTCCVGATVVGCTPGPCQR
jgi:hypothetical protein